MAGPLTSLLWLTLGAFAIATEGFMIPALLPALARDLDVGLPDGGQSHHCVLPYYAFGAPVVAVLTAEVERKRLLAVAMGGFAFANVLAALAPDYFGLMGASVLLALTTASFIPPLVDMLPASVVPSGRVALCPWSPAD